VKLGIYINLLNFGTDVALVEVVSIKKNIKLAVQLVKLNRKNHGD